MLSHIRTIFAPPVFPEDEDKTRLARVLNTLLISAFVLLFLDGCIAIPFIYVEKTFNTILGLILLVLMSVVYLFMRHGHVHLAGELYATGLWLVFTAFIFYSGEMSSVLVIYYLLGAVVTSLLLGTTSAMVYVAACSLAGLVMVILEVSGHPLPHLLPVQPFVGWMDMLIALSCTIIVLRLFLNDLRDSLLLTRQRYVALQQTETALRESEERFSRLSSVSFEGIGISDQGIISDANTQLAYMFGYKPNELLGMDASVLVAPESRDLVLANEKAEFEGPYEHLAIKKDGTIFPVEIHSRTIPYKGRQLRVAITRDITERKQTESALRISEEKFRTMIEQATEGFALVDENGILIEWNSAMERIWGGRREEVLGQPFYEIQFQAIKPERRTTERYEYFKTALMDASRSGQSRLFNHSLEAEIYRPDGSHVFVKQSIFPIKTECGYRIGSVAIDITEQKRVTEQMKSHERYLTMLNMATKEILTSEEIGDLYYRLTTRLVNMFVADYGYFIQWDEQQQLATLLATTKTLTQPFSSMMLTSEEALLTNSVMQTGEILSIEDVFSSQYVVDPAIFKDRSLSIRSVLCIPLVARQYQSGMVIIVFSTLHRFTTEELENARLAGNQLALALYTFEQDKKIRAQYKEASAFASIEQILSEIEQVGINSVLQFISKSVRGLIPEASHVVLHLLDIEKQHLVPRAVAGYTSELGVSLNMRIGEGVAGQVIDEGNVIIVSDAQLDPRFKNQEKTIKFRSLMVAPIKSRETVVGTISVQSDQPDLFTIEDSRLLGKLGILAGVAIDNSNLLETTQQDLKEINALYHISQGLVASLDPKQLMKDTVELLEKEFGFSYVQIYLVEPLSGDMVSFQGSNEIGASLKEMVHRLPAGVGIVGHVAETGQAFFTNDVDKVLFFYRNPLLPDTQSELAVPIKIKDKVYGVLDIQQNSPTKFNSRHIQLMMAVTDQLAVALHQANLYTELQTSLSNEQATHSQLLQSEKLAVVGRLLASVSHELNNPLQAIQNALYLLKNEKSISSQGEKDLKIVLSEAERMATLLERLRTTYQLVRAEEFQPIQINALVEDVHALLTTLLRHAFISFEFHSDPNLPAISGLGDQLKQVLLNLFMNAVDAMPAGGHLIATTACLSERREILITVTDTGTGIDKSILPNLFEAFTTTKEKGTGLGLAISYEIVLKHRGRIRAENRTEGGATFLIWLPLDNGAEL